MSEILHTFGLQWPRFFAQIIVVLTVYFVLSKYAFGPVMGMLELRRKRIMQGEENLKKIETELASAEEKVQAMLDVANKDAERLINEAKESAATVREQKTQDAIAEAQQIIEKARAASQMEHERTMNELKRDFGQLVIEATTKVSGKVLNESDQKRINEETAAQIAL